MENVCNECKVIAELNLNFRAIILQAKAGIVVSPQYLESTIEYNLWKQDLKVY